MPRIKSRIKHDYRALEQPQTARPRIADRSTRRGRWFVVGALLPLTVAAAAIWQSQSAVEPPQNLVSATLIPTAKPSSDAKTLIPADKTAAAKTLAPANQTTDTAGAHGAHDARIVLRLPQPQPGSNAVVETASKQPGEKVTLTIRSGDTLDELFKDRKLSRSDLAQILKLPEARSALTVLIPGDTVEIRHEDGRILELARKLDTIRSLNITAPDEAGTGFASRIIEQPVEIRMQHANGTIDSSLFLSAQEAGISDTLIMNLAGIFAWDVDFVLDIRRGDTFALVYEEIWQDGHFLKNGGILAAEFQNNGTTFRAVRYADPEGKTGYFTPDGLNVKKAFLRAPIAFTPRVTSNFNPRRYHPVHKKVRPHRGVDYGAPKGTAIKSAGDGKVIFRGRKNGYGNTIIVQHGGNITTLYAHMSKFNGQARVGRRVKQGQTVGYVGSTGTATGNHLHYEYRLNGVHRNPRTVKLPQAKPVPTKFKDDFLAATRPLINHLEVVSKIQRLARAD